MNKQIKQLQTIENNRIDSVWYGGDIVTIILDNRYYCTITAAGEIRAKIKGNYYCDKNNGGRFKEYLNENGIYNDEQLKQAIQDGDVEFGDNNWFELIIWDDTEKQYINDYDNVVDISPDDDYSWVEDTLQSLLD